MWLGVVRISNGRSEKTTFLIVDTQSIKNTDTSEHKGYDAVKEISGIKRHIAVDTQGLPHAIAVTTAGVTDRKGHWMLLSITKNRCWRWSIFLPIVLIGASLLRTGLLKYLERRSRLPSVMSFTLLKWCHNDGSLSALLAVLKNAGNFGKTVNFSSIPGCN